jgi:hypothetical protein
MTVVFYTAQPLPVEMKLKATRDEKHQIGILLDPLFRKLF